jgi:hypothetical protein
MELFELGVEPAQLLRVPWVRAAELFEVDELARVTPRDELGEQLFRPPRELRAWLGHGRAW